MAFEKPFLFYLVVVGTLFPCISAYGQATSEIAEKHLELAAKYSEETDGLSVLVMVDDKIVFERYHYRYSAEKYNRLASGTKSFWGVAAICAEEDGFLTLDELASATLTEWKDDPRKSKISIRHLLTSTSGLDPANAVLRGPQKDNKYLYAINVDTKHEPGEVFEYGAGHLFAFGELFRRKLHAAGKDDNVLAYLKRRIADPIGMKFGNYRSDRTDNPQLPFGAFMSAHEWIKFGKLILHRGKWNGEEIIPSDKIDQCFEGTKANPIYGLNWWLIGKSESNSANGPGIPSDTVAALGKGKNHLYVIPSLNLVAVRQGDSQAFQDTDFLNRLLFGLETNTSRRTRAGQQ